MTSLVLTSSMNWSCIASAVPSPLASVVASARTSLMTTVIGGCGGGSVVPPPIVVPGENAALLTVRCWTKGSSVFVLPSGKRVTELSPPALAAVLISNSKTVPAG